MQSLTTSTFVNATAAENAENMLPKKCIFSAFAIFFGSHMCFVSVTVQIIDAEYFYVNMDNVKDQT